MYTNVIVFALVLLSPLPFVSPFSYDAQHAEAIEFFDNPPPPQNTPADVNQASTFELIEVEFFSDVEPAASLNSTGFLFQGLVNIDAIDIDGSIFVMSASTSGGIQFLNVTDPESIRANSDRGSYKISSQVINPCTSCISDNAFPSDIFPIKIGGFTYALVTMFVSYDVGSLPDIFPTTGNLVQIRNITNLNDNGAVYESELNPTDGIVGASRIVGVEIDGFTYAIITSDLGIQIANITNVTSPEVVFNITDGDAGYEKLGGALGITTAQIDGSHYALVAARTDDSVTIINITDPTSPSNVSLIANSSEYPKLDGPSDITTTEINGTYYALVTAYNDDSVTIINITDPASPNHVTTITDGVQYPELDEPHGINAIQINGMHYAIVASFADSGVQMINIDTPSSPNPSFNITNGSGGYTILGNPKGIVTVQIQELNYSFIGSSKKSINDAQGIQVIRHTILPYQDTLPVVITSNNSNNRYAKAGDNITVKINVTKIISNHNATILNLANTNDIVSGKELNASILVPDSPLEGNATFNITVSNGTDTLTITKDDLKFTENIFIDTIPPDIALMGNSIYTVYQNTNEVIPGATVTDGDPNYSGGYNVSMNDTLDTSILGLVVNYTYTANPDTAGNPGKSVNRTITVIEPPLITISNFFLYANSPYLKNGDSISIFFGTKANITNYTNVAYGVNGNNVKNTGLTFTPRHSPNALDSYSAYITISNDLNGNFTFSLNITSNLGRTETLTQDDVAMNQNSAGIQSFIIIDTRVPGIENLTIYSDNSRDDYAMAGDLLNITVTANEVLESANITILGDTYVMNVSGAVANASVNVDQNSAEGVVLFSITADDLAGNRFTANQMQVESNVTIDTTSPSISLIGADNITIFLNTPFTDPNATAYDLSYGEINVSGTGALNTTKPGTYMLTYTAPPDYAGNAGNIANRTIIVKDALPINITSLNITSNNTNGTVYAKAGDTLTVHLVVNDTINSYTAQILGSDPNVSVNNNVIIANLTVPSDPLEANATFAIYVETDDGFLNVTENNLTSNIFVDTIAPVLHVGGSTSDITVPLTYGFGSNIVQYGGFAVTEGDPNYPEFEQRFNQTGELDRFTAGSSIVQEYYTDPDGAGNIANTINVTFTVGAPAVISVESLNIFSSSGDNFSRADQNVTVMIVTDGYNLTNAVGTILNETFTSVFVNDSANFTRTIQSDDINGNATFAINVTHHAVDAFGAILFILNITEADITNDTFVTVDTLNPILANLTIYSDNTNTSFATINNTLNITVTANETLKNANITIWGSTYVMNVSGAVANASVTVDQNSVEGEVLFNITAFDLAGNNFTADQTELDSSNVIIDTSSPMLDNLTIYSNNANTSLATINNILNITVTANETLKNANITILGSTYVMNVSGAVANASVNVDQNSVEGEVLFNITAFDLAGNNFTADQTELDSSNVIIDTSSPMLDNLTIYSNNANTSLATINNILNITITANETIKNANITILGSTYVMNVSGAVANASVNVDQNSVEGEVLFNITAFDLAGNNLTADQTELDSSNVIIDTSSPMLDNLIIYSNNSIPNYAMAGHLLNITITANETLKNANITILGSTYVMNVSGAVANASVNVDQNSVEGEVLFNITAFDLAGNNFTADQTELDSSNVIIDTSSPMLDNLTIYSNNANTSLATINNILNITITANETIKNANITILGSTYVMNVSGAVANASVNVDQNSVEGEVLFNITAFDLAGNNLTADQTELDSSNVIIDTSSPMLDNLVIYSNNSIPNYAMAGHLLNITITANETLKNANITILGSTYVMNVSGAVANASVNVDQNSVEGEVLFNITAFDLAGNNFTADQTELDSSNVIIDNESPMLDNLTIYSNNANTSLATINNILNITITANETIKNANITILGSTYVMNVSGAVANASVNVDQNSVEGEVLFNITAFDLAGNNFTADQTELDSSNVIIDHSIPSVQNLSVISNNSDPKFAMAGDTINITLQVSEQIENSTLQTLNTSTPMLVINDTASATVTVLENSPNGHLEFNITAYDKTGNVFNVTHDNVVGNNTVIDTNDPSLVNLGIYSNNSIPNYAMAGHLLNITITANETLKNANITILGSTYVMNVSGAVANASVNVYSNSTKGEVLFNITAFDLAGNNFTADQTELGSSNVIIDNENPMLDNLTIYSNNANTSLATINNILNITITANETLKNANITILGSTYVMGVNGTVANASVNVHSNSTEGKVLFNITAFDLAGNNFTADQTELDSSNVIIDHSIPSVQNLSVISNNSDPKFAMAGDTINITLQVSEQIENSTLQTLNTSTPMLVINDTASATVTVLENSPNGHLEFNITAYDKTGNVFNVTHDNVVGNNTVIDTNDPSLVNLAIYSNNSIPNYAMAGHLLNITITANETLKNANITILGSTYVMNVSGAVANASVNVYSNSTKGEVLFNITAFDLAGNNFTADQTELDSSNVIIDTSSPMLDNLTIYSNNANTSLATVNNILNITITANETLKNANITILGSTYVMNVSGAVANASVNVDQNSVEGEVLFNITAFDLAGNNFTADQTELDSSNVIIDTSSPMLDNLTIYSNNSIPNYAMAGHLLNITITANETLKNANITILGSTYVMNVSGAVANASVNVYSNSTKGEVLFNITAFDLAGNNFTADQTELDSSNVIIDTSSPMLDNLTIYSNNSIPNYAMAGHLLNITITANETLKNANITILGSTYVMNVSGAVANASVNVYSNSTKGEVLFNITAFDLAGNNFTADQTELDSSNVIIDTSSPMLDNLTIYSNNSIPNYAMAGHLLNITITANETLKNANITILGSTYVMNVSGAVANASVNVYSNSTKGEVLFNITAFDLAGNNFTADQTELDSSNVIIDTSSPMLDNLTIYSNNSIPNYAMAGHLLNITITANETLKNANITILGSTYVMNVSGAVANASVNVYSNSTKGEVLFNITAFDLAGNNFTADQTELDSSNVIIDTSSPMLDNLTIYSNNVNASLATVNNILNITITANETLKNANITILGSTYVMNVSGAVANASVNVYSNSTKGEVLFNITAFDLAGNNFTADQTELDSSNVIIDNENPMLDNLTIYSNNANTSLATINNILNITITANETIKNANITILGSTYVMNVSGAVANASVNVDQNSVEGEVLFNITAFDLAGNNFTADQTELDSSNVIIDTSSPMLDNLTIYSNNSIPNYAMAGHLLNITITANETLKNANITILGSTYVMNVSGAVANASVNVYSNSTKGEVLFNITAFDLAGNNFTADQTELDSSNVIIDNENPMLDNLTIYSNNSIPNYAMAGHLLNITITANETLKNANITILGSTYVMNVSGAVANASVNVYSNSTKGEVLFNITAFDLAGNNFTADQTELDSSNVIIDTSSPMLDNLTIYSNNSIPNYAMAGHLLNITITANETIKNANITILGSTYVMNVSGAVANASVNVDQNSVEGEVLFNITAFDLAGNNFTADQTELDSSNVIIDTSSPMLDNLTIYSNNANTSLATINNILNITITANETIKNANITILGSTYVMNVSGAVANASVNVDQNSVEGEVLFNITAFDLAGNNFTADQTELDSSNVIIDTSSPMLDNLTIYSNNANTSLATINNILNITITANETIKNANITILGSTYVMNVSGAVANASVNVDQNSVEGEVLFNITAFDLAGNNFTADQTELDSSNVIIDTSSPMLDNLVIYSNNSIPNYAMAGHLLNITITANETLKNANITILGSTYVMNVSGAVANASVNVYSNSTKGEVLFNITAFDLTGNNFTADQTELDSSNVIIDNESPMLDNLTIYSNNANASLATVNNILNITITANEALKNANITILGSTYVMNVSGAVANASVTVSQDSTEGNASFDITAFDLAGNNFTADQTELDSSNVIIDHSIPSVQYLNVTSNNSDPKIAMEGDTINITLQVSENIENSTLQILNESIPMNVSKDTANATITVMDDSTNGPLKFNITAYDKTGNVFNVTQAIITGENVIIDTNDPSLVDLTIYSNNSMPDYAMAGHLLNITITANETIKNANITILGSTYVMNVSGAVANASVNVYSNSTKGEVLFNITAFDLAGNNFTADQTELDSSNVTIDNESPMLENLIIYSNNANPSLATVNNILNITITANETLKNANITILGDTYGMNVSGAVANANVTVDQNSAEGDVLFNITAFDLAGNNFTADQTELDSSNVIIDHSIPSVQYLNVTSNNSNSSLARAGDLINITLEVSEQIENSTLQILNESIPMTINNDTANATITVMDDSPNGPLEFNITAYDKTGNVFNVTQANITGENVIIDTNDPSLVDLTIYSNNSIPGYAMAGHLLNITITANETLKNANITILGSTYVMNVSGAVANASVNVYSNSTKGEVLFNITAFDLAGNNFTADQTELDSSNVTIDNESPMLENLIIYSNNANTSLATVNNILNITITANETLKNANITILGDTYGMNVSGAVANASVTVDQNSAEGDVLFNITAFDLAGNNFTADQTELDSSNVIIDHSIPSVQYLNVTSDNSNSSLARAGDLINIALEVSEQIENSTLQILNNDIVMSVNGDTANATITVMDDSPNGPLEFNITAYDKTGNVFNVTQANITGENVIIDTNDPSLVDLTIYSNNSIPGYAMAGHLLNITITANETLKNANITILGSTYVMNVSGAVANASVNVYSNSTKGEVLFNITAFDLAGNNFTADQTELGSSNVTIDNESPMLENLIIYSNNANTSLATVNNILNITITANETLKNANITILGDTYGMNVSGAVANASVTVDQNSAEGDVLFNITAFDLAGNNFTADQTELDSSNVIIDHSIPSVQYLNVTSDNSNSSLARAGDLINIALEVSEQIENSTLQILNNDIVMSVNGDTANATITVMDDSPNGPLEFNITAYDKTGNVFNVTQANITGENVIIDTNDPSLVDLTIYSNNSIPGYAMAGHLLNITITANETLKNANITILGSTYVMNVSGAVANASVNVYSNSTKGEVLFNITAFDLAGNNFTADQTELGSSNVTIDNESPMLENLIIYSNNANTSLATVNNILNITITANETLKNANITILGSTYVMNVSGAVANASVTVDQNSAEGDVLFNITAFDLAGNNFTADQTELDSSNVIIDHSIPSVQYLNVTSNNSNSSLARAGDLINITLEVSEQIENSTLQILNESIPMTINNDTASATITVMDDSPNGPLEFNIAAYDKTGNVFSVTQAIITGENVIIDTNDPSLVDLTIYSNNANPSLATINNILNITITANETLKDASITILGSTHVMSVNGAVANASVTVDQNSVEGNVSFGITAFDLAGNSFTADQTELDSSNVTIDSSIPSVQYLNVVSDNSDPKIAMAGNTITITLQVSEQIESSTLQIRNTNTTMTINDDTASATITVLQNSPNGPLEFSITAYDKTGNVFNAAQDIITDGNVVIDTNSPSLADLTIYSDNSRTDYAMAGHLLNITITANETLKDASITILGSTHVMSVNGAVANASVNVYSNSTKGEVSFAITAFDLAGNRFTVDQTDLLSSNVIIDTSSPMVEDLTIDSNNANPSLATINNILYITMTANDTLKNANITILGDTYGMNVSGAVANASVTVDQNSAEGNVSFDITAFDLAGNSFTVDQTQLFSPNVIIDRTNPQLVDLLAYSDDNNTSLARIGDVVNITLNVTESLQSATIGILDNTITMDIVNNIAYTAITVLQNHANGPLEFNITAYDKTGNILNVTQDDITGDNVVIDTIDPSLEDLTIYSNNTNPSFAKVNDNVTITLTTKEPIGSISGTILDQTINARVNGNISTASILIDQSTTNGYIEFSINIHDTNDAYMTTITQHHLNTTNVFVDTTVPVIELILGANSAKDLDGNVGDRAKINNTYHDPGSHIRDNDPTFDDVANTTSTVDTSASGIYYVKYDAVDNAGNIAQSVYRTISVLNSDDSINVALPLSIPNPVIYSHITHLNTTEWNNNDAISFTHDLVIIQNDTVLIKIENGTELGSVQENVDFDNFLINGYLSNNDRLIVTLGHSETRYDIQNNSAMITFLNVRDITAMPYYWENTNESVTNITEYSNNDIFDGSAAHQFLTTNSNSNYNGSKYVVDEDNRRITIWTNHLTSFVLNVTTGNHGDDDNDYSAPTIGLGSFGNRLVENGFEYNGLAVNANRYHTEFPLITTNVGDVNTIKIKMYDSTGSTGIKRVEFALGVPDIGLYHEAEAFVEVWMQRGNITVEKIIIVDELDILEDSEVSASVSETSCSGGEQQCLLLEMQYSYREPPAYNTIAIKPVNWDNNAFQFYFNDGIHVDGASINLPKEIEISTSHATSLVGDVKTLRLLQTDRANNLWTDQFGYQWEIIGNTIRQITIPEYIISEDEQYGILHGPDRYHSEFSSVMYAEQIRAQETLADILGESTLLKPLPEHGGTMYFDAVDADSRDGDSFKLLLELEAERMQQISNLLYNYGTIQE